jgi:hypothetical protein
MSACASTRQITRLLRGFTNAEAKGRYTGNVKKLSIGTCDRWLSYFIREVCYRFQRLPLKTRANGLVSRTCARGPEF